jgi:protein dithiol:quinone oxidoreductase
MVLNRIGRLWLVIGIAGIGIGLASVGLTEWLRLDPCHLCIFQRLLMLMAGAFALVTAGFIALGLNSLIPGIVTLLTALSGAAVAAHHSWIQAFPSETNSCGGGANGPIESAVEWLGQQMPALFLATGFCEDDGFRLLGLTLANLSLLLFTVLAGAALWALFHSVRARLISPAR